MKGAFIIFCAMIVIGIALYFNELRYRRTHKLPGRPDQSEIKEQSEVSEVSEVSELSPSTKCCGLHLICEQELDSVIEGKIIYYDDEELDVYAGRDPEDYTEAETEEFREILLTMLPQDVPGWARSLDRRGIRPPAEIRQEILILLSE